MAGTEPQHPSTAPVLPPCCSLWPHTPLPHPPPSVCFPGGGPRGRTGHGAPSAGLVCGQSSVREAGGQAPWEGGPEARGDCAGRELGSPGAARRIRPSEELITAAESDTRPTNRETTSQEGAPRILVLTQFNRLSNKSKHSYPNGH